MKHIKLKLKITAAGKITSTSAPKTLMVKPDTETLTIELADSRKGSALSFGPIKINHWRMKSETEKS